MMPQAGTGGFLLPVVCVVVAKPFLEGDGGTLVDTSDC